MLILCIGAAAYLGYKAGSELLERKAGDDFYDQLAVEVQKDDVLKDDESAPELADAPTDEAISVDFDTLLQSCPDVVGWIKIDGTCIDYPVVLGKDNDFYLHHLPDQTANSAGSIMMDCANDGTFDNTVNILHGHHMRNGSMFGDLDEYAEESYYKAHPVIHLYTPSGNYEVEIFAACTVNGSTFGYPTGFETTEAFDEFIQTLKLQTAYDTGVDVQENDKILLLSTCAYSFNTARFIVAGKIIGK